MFDDLFGLLADVSIASSARRTALQRRPTLFISSVTGAEQLESVSKGVPFLQTSLGLGSGAALSAAPGATSRSPGVDHACGGSVGQTRFLAVRGACRAAP